MALSTPESDSLAERSLAASLRPHGGDVHAVTVQIRVDMFRRIAAAEQKPSVDSGKAQEAAKKILEKWHKRGPPQGQTDSQKAEDDRRSQRGNEAHGIRKLRDKKNLKRGL